MTETKTALRTPKIDVHCHVFRSEDWAASSDLLIDCSNILGIVENWCSSPILGGKIEPIESVRVENDAVLTSMARHPDRIRGLCFVIPGPDAVSEIERCLDAGMIGIKLYNQYRINDAIVRPIIELAIERRVPILEHAGAPNPEHKTAQPLISHGIHFAEVNERYPDAMIYHAHIGGGGDWEYTIRALRDCSPNLYVDVSGSNLDYDQVGFAVDELGAERVLFGTDGTMAGSIGKVIEADISEADRQMVWYQNAARILEAQGITATTVPSEEGTSKITVSESPQTKESSTPELIDLNAWLGSYPFRSVQSTPAELLKKIDRFGISKAAVSSIEAAYHRNVQPANERLFAQIDGHRDRLIPLGTISPMYPKWEQDLARCVDAGARGIRILPQCHDYRLDGPVGDTLVEAISDAGLPIFIPHRIEDIRERHWMDPGSALDLGTIAETISRFPETTFVINNARSISRSPLWQRDDVRNANWYLDLSLAEIHYGLHWGIATAQDLQVIIEAGGAGHFVFGSHQPFSYVAPALVKMATLGVDAPTYDGIANKSAAMILGLDS